MGLISYGVPWESPFEHEYSLRINEIYHYPLTRPQENGTLEQGLDVQRGLSEKLVEFYVIEDIPG